MREYKVKVLSSWVREEDLTTLFNSLSSSGWIFDKMCACGADRMTERVYIVFYREKM